MSELQKHYQDRDEDFLEYDYYGNPTPESIARERELKERTYSTGEFAAKAHVTIRTIRYYDKKDLLKPSYRTESEARRYTDEDFVKLQQILLFKYLGFSLDEIRELTIGALDPENLTQSLRVQKRLIEERVEQMQAMTTAIDRTIGQLQHHLDIGERPLEAVVFLQLVLGTLSLLQYLLRTLLIVPESFLLGDFRQPAHLILKTHRVKGTHLPLSVCSAAWVHPL